MKIDYFWLVLFVLWGVLGISTLRDEDISKVSYGLAWIGLMSSLMCNVIGA